MKQILRLFAFLIMIFLPLASHSLETTPSSSNQDKNNINKTPLYWIDTMEPDIHYTAPGKSRMGMELVPVYPDQAKTVSPPKE